MKVHIMTVAGFLNKTSKSVTIGGNSGQSYRWQFNNLVPPSVL